LGTLYVCATPIGNLEDAPPRLIRTLKEVDLVVAEDTRSALKLFQVFGIRKPLVSFFRHNVRQRIPGLLEKLRAGENMALITDAGVPGISDPGPELVSAAAAEGIPITVIPGPSAVTTALAISGFPADEFIFIGFLPVKAGKRRKVLSELQDEKRTVVLFESPHRIRKVLGDISTLLPDRQIVVCRELTKKFETTYRGYPRDVNAELLDSHIRGEFTVILSPLP